MRLDVAIDFARPMPGACHYLAGDVLLLRREWTSRTSGAGMHRSAAALVLASSPSEEHAGSALIRIIEDIVPRMEFGDHAAASLVQMLDQIGGQEPPRGAVAWTDGHRVRVAFCGPFRCVFQRQGQGSRLPPHDDRRPGWADIPMAIGDWFIMAPPATEMALPLGSILALAQAGTHAIDLCRTAATRAGTADPLNHHAVTAIHIGAAG